MSAWVDHFTPYRNMQSRVATPDNVSNHDYRTFCTPKFWSLSSSQFSRSSKVINTNYLLQILWLPKYHVSSIVQWASRNEVPRKCLLCLKLDPAVKAPAQDCNFVFKLVVREVLHLLLALHLLASSITQYIGRMHVFGYLRQTWIPKPSRGHKTKPNLFPVITLIT